MSAYTIEQLPDEALPPLEELSGDLRILAEMVGVRLALQVSERFDCTPARLFGHKKLIRSWRHSCLRRDYDTGKYTVVELARIHGVSERQAYNILGMEPGEDRQLRLF